MSDFQHPMSEDLAPSLPASRSKPESRSLFDIFPSLRFLKDFCDYLGGSREKPPVGFAFLASPWWLGIWWGLLAGLILLFCGQTSKFIYIDF
jgi:hypothetical protein